jgi:hypothetical protein
MNSHIIPATSSVETVISSIINGHTNLTIEQQLTNHLDSIPRSERLQQAQDLLFAASEADGLVAEFASKIWTYVMIHQLWESKYPTLQAFKESISYDDRIHGMLERYNGLSIRQQAYARSILANWKSLPFEALPVELHPPKFSRDLLQGLSVLSKICSLDQAIVLLKEQVRDRQLLAGSSSSAGPFYSKIKAYIMIADVTKVCKNLQDLRLQMASRNNELKESRYV